MTEIEQKALALVNEYFYVERTDLDSCDRFDLLKALCLSIEQYEQFKREVSKVAEWAVRAGYDTPDMRRFILPKPVDPLVEVINDADDMVRVPNAPSYAEAIRAALAKRGLEVREIEG